MATAMGFDGGPAHVAWLAPFPYPIALTWSENDVSCIGTGAWLCSGGAPHQFQIAAVRCDGCDVLVQTADGFRPFTQGDFRTQLYARPTVVGNVSLAIDLESVDGVQATASLQMTADRITAMTPWCSVLSAHDVTLGACSDFASRSADSTVEIGIAITMERGGWDYLGSVSPHTAEFRTFLPKLSSDDAPLVGSSFSLVGTSATTETVTWDGVAAPVTFEIPPVR